MGCSHAAAASHAGGQHCKAAEWGHGTLMPAVLLISMRSKAHGQGCGEQATLMAFSQKQRAFQSPRFNATLPDAPTPHRGPSHHRAGSYAVNPANGQEVPVWVADYVLGGYGRCASVSFHAGTRPQGPTIVCPAVKPHHQPLHRLVAGHVIEFTFEPHTAPPHLRYILNLVAFTHSPPPPCSGAVMSVPAHDSRDYEFALKYGITPLQVRGGQLPMWCVPLPAAPPSSSPRPYL